MHAAITIDPHTHHDLKNDYSETTEYRQPLGKTGNAGKGNHRLP